MGWRGGNCALWGPVTPHVNGSFSFGPLLDVLMRKNVVFALMQLVEEFYGTPAMRESANVKVYFRAGAALRP